MCGFIGRDYSGVNILCNKGIELTKGESIVLETLRKIYKDVTYNVFIYVQAMIGNKRPSERLVRRLYS